MLSSICGGSSVIRFPSGPRFAQKNSGLHRLTQGVDGGIRDLRGVDQDLIPVNGQRFGIPHGREQNAAGICLLVDLLDRSVIPVCVFTQAAFVFYDFQRVRGAKGNAALAVDALCLVADHHALFLKEGVHFVCALPLANAAGNTARIAPDHVEFRRNVDPVHICAPSFTRITTGSPPAGAQMFSASGSIRRIAASSLAI